MNGLIEQWGVTSKFNNTTKDIALPVKYLSSYVAQTSIFETGKTTYPVGVIDPLSLNTLTLFTTNESKVLWHTSGY